MALPPKFAGHRLTFSSDLKPLSSTNSTHTLEFYLDYVCPFSAKLFKTLYEGLAPAIRAHPQWKDSLTIIFRQQVQPWHPSSTLVHEAALAVLRLAPDRFWEFSGLLFEEQQAYFDVNVVNETRNNTYRRLADLAAKVGVSADEVYRLLVIPTEPPASGFLNAGNEVTADLKVVIKMNRLIGIHVSPTAVLDGVVQDTSSSWTVDQWKELLSKHIV